MSKKIVVVECESYHLANMPTAKPPNAFDLFVKYSKTYTPEELQKVIYNSVLTNSLKELEYLHTKGTDFNFTILGFDLLTVAVSQPDPNLALIKFLLKVVTNHTHAIEQANNLWLHCQTPEAKHKMLEVKQTLTLNVKPHTMLATAPVHTSAPKTPTQKND